jgi:hypothetical protein
MKLREGMSTATKVLTGAWPAANRASLLMLVKGMGSCEGHKRACSGQVWFTFTLGATVLEQD